jgi:MFS family permease
LRHNRDYVAWLVGETMSMVGTSVSTFAYPLLILFATHSAAKTGIVAAAANIGILATMLVGGVLADRYSRRTILVAAPAVQALVVASVGAAALAGHVVLVHVAAAGFVDGALVGVTRGAQTASLRRIVPGPEYAMATAQLHARDMGIRVAGPPVGGLLFTLSRALPFLFDAVSYVAAIAGVMAVKRPLGPDAAQTREPLGQAVREGLRFVVGTPYMRFLVWWAALMNMLGSGLMLLVILLVRAHGGNPTVIGAAQAIGAVGGVAGGLVAARVITRLAGRSLVIALSWTLAAAALGIALIPSAWAIGVMLAVVNLVATPMNVMFSTYEVQVIPDHLLGRVTTTLDLAANCLRWIAPLAVGFLVEATSARTTGLVWAAAFAAVASLVVVNRSLQLLDRPLA